MKSSHLLTDLLVNIHASKAPHQPLVGVRVPWWMQDSQWDVRSAWVGAHEGSWFTSANYVGLQVPRKPNPHSFYCLMISYHASGILLLIPQSL